jgi:hypothetical protein
LRRHYNQAPDSAKSWRYQLNKSTRHLAVLTEARAKGLATDDGEIEQAAQAKAERYRRLAAVRPTPAPDKLATLAQRIRALMVLNDPDAVRAGLEEIAAALESRVSN